MQLVEKIRRAYDLETQLIDTILDGLGIVGIGLFVYKELIEKGFAICGYALAGFTEFDLLQERKLKVLLEVPRQTFFLLGGEGIGDGEGVLAFIVEA